MVWVVIIEKLSISEIHLTSAIRLVEAKTEKQVIDMYFDCVEYKTFKVKEDAINWIIEKIK